MEKLYTGRPVVAVIGARQELVVATMTASGWASSASLRSVVDIPAIQSNF